MSRPTEEERAADLRYEEVSTLERIAAALERIADILDPPKQTGS